VVVITALSSLPSSESFNRYFKYAFAKSLPSDVILWINTPFDTKNFKRKYESLIKTAPLLKVVFSVFWGRGCKKKIDRFRPTFIGLTAEKSWPKFGVAQERVQHYK
jgi:hypothetical protein